MRRWEYYAGQVVTERITSHVSHVVGREDGASGYLAGCAPWWSAATLAELKSWNWERSGRKPEAQRAPEAGSSHVRERSSPVRQHRQHLMRKPHHNLHNCRTTWIQAQCTFARSHNNTRSIRQTPCACHLLISHTKDHERNRPYHPEARQAA
jgi:hypothetical protein